MPGSVGACGSTSAIIAIDSTFVDAWLKDDTTKVLSVFASDAVLMPPGVQPVVGLAAIRAYWWPSDGSHTRITSFTRAIAEVGGGGGVAFVRGTAAVGWTYAKSSSSGDSAEVVRCMAESLPGSGDMR